MGILDFIFKKKNKEPPIPDDEKKFYQRPEYYTEEKPTAAIGMNKGSASAKVITFEERKKISYPSKNGLYVAEILLLQYCDYGNYPNPRSGYPGFWWFEYGIKNVGYVLDTLAKRGFIELNSVGKYQLTQKGKTELDDNAYIPYMHKADDKTNENGDFGPVFNVWSINQQLKGENTNNWRQIVEIKRAERAAYFKRKQEQLKQNPLSEQFTDERLKQEAKKLEDELSAQDEQIEKIHKAEQQYKDDGDIKALIAFWENIWKSGGLLFNGSTMTFRLPDLYIKEKRYSDALKIVKRIKRGGKYNEKADKYIQRIEKHLDKSKGSK